MDDEPEYTCEQMQRLTFHALVVGDMEAVEHAMTYMAIYYPDTAKLIMDTATFVRALDGGEEA